MAPRTAPHHARWMSATVIHFPKRRHQRIVVLQSIGTGIFGALLWTAFAVEHVRVFLQTGRVVGIGLAVVEVYAAALFVMRRPADRTSQRPADWVYALVGTFGALALRPGGAHSQAGDVLGLALQAAGVLVVLLGLGALGRSFGVVAAQRDLVTTGAYRIVRHPLYAAYALIQLGYFVQSVRLWNVGVLVAVWVAQIARIRAEERFLSRDATYARYARTTRFRLVPGLW
jgi:protein-S-isoprenylcysteine O-methyltransferase Ste14